MKSKHTLPPRLYYTINQAAADIGADPDHLLHLAAIGVIPIFAILKGYYSVIPLIDETVTASTKDIESCTAGQLIEAIHPALGLHCQSTLLGLWQWNAAEVERFGETKADSFSRAIELPHTSTGLTDIGETLEASLASSNIPYQCDCFVVTPGTYDGAQIATGVIGPKGREGAGSVISKIYNLKRFSMTIRKENLYLTQSEVAKLKGIETDISQSGDVAAPKGIARINREKAAAKERAKQIAQTLWQADSEQKLRLSDMADIVYRQLVSDGMKDALPERTDGVNCWLKPIAPDYARRPGRAKKSP